MVQLLLFNFDVAKVGRIFQSTKLFLLKFLKTSSLSQIHAFSPESCVEHTQSSTMLYIIPTKPHRDFSVSNHQERRMKPRAKVVWILEESKQKGREINPFPIMPFISYPIQLAKIQANPHHAANRYRRQQYPRFAIIPLLFLHIVPNFHGN